VTQIARTPQAGSADRPPAAIRVEVFSDIICPWCYIGARRLTGAVEQFSGAHGRAVDVVWRPFELNPDMPVAGLDRRAYRSARFGSWARSQQLDHGVAEAGATEGLVFRHDLMLRTPNTRAAHRLVALSQQHGCGSAMVEGLFAAYFTRGQDVGDPAVLLALAGQVGLAPADDADAVAGSGELGRRTEADVATGLRRAGQLGISGVPFHLIGGRYGVSGAQPASLLAQVLRRAADDARAVAPLPSDAGHASDDNAQNRQGGAGCTPEFCQ